LPIDKYSLLIGKAVFSRLGSGENPHYSIEVVDNTKQYRIAVNVQSDEGSDVEYVIFPNWEHPIIDYIQKMEPGLHPIENKNGMPALDYIRANIASPNSFISLPMNLIGPNNDLNEKINQYVWRAMADSKSRIYAFGSAWGPEEQSRDQVFGFLPGYGIHNIHMNQGNDDDKHKVDNGVWQDGGLIFHFSKPDQWVAIFLKFKSQSWHTKDDDGDPIEKLTYSPLSDLKSTLMSNSIIQTASGRPEGLIKIMAARISDIEGPEQSSSVTILNISNFEISLNGWSIVDIEMNQMYLYGKIDPGMAKTLSIIGHLNLSNRGGLITLLDDEGTKVDGVAFSHSKLREPGWTITF